MKNSTAVTVSLETHQRIQLLRGRLLALDPHKLSATFAPLLERGASLSAIVSIGILLLEQELEQLETTSAQPAPRSLNAIEKQGETKPKRQNRKLSFDDSHLLAGEKVDCKKADK